MRTALRKRGVKHLKVVYSDEIPTRPIEDMSISCRAHCICPPGAKHKCTGAPRIFPAARLSYRLWQD